MKADIEKLFLDSLINSLPDNIYFKDTESRFLMVNRALARRFGLKDPSEALGRTDFDFFDGKHAAEARADELQVMSTGKPVIGKEEHEIANNGAEQWVLTTKLPLFDTDGKMIGTFGVSRDVTEIKQAQDALKKSEEALRRQQDILEDEVRKRTEELSDAYVKMEKEVQERRLAEQSLRISEERYRRLLDVNPTYIYTVTLSKRVPIKTEHGPGCINVTGYTPEEYLENPNLWIIMVHPDDRELVKKFVTEDLTQRNHQNQIEHRVIHKDGRPRWVRNTVVHHYDDEGELVRYDGLVEDITARRSADDRQRENERLRAIVKLADGVATSYSKLVKQIETHASAIARRVTKETVLHEHAASILDTLSHVSSLNGRLISAAKAYSHDPQAKDFLQEVNIPKIVKQAAKTSKRYFSGQDIEIKTFIPPEIPLVAANPDQLLETVNSMLINAYEAMPSGGTITITASCKKILKSAHRWNQIARGGSYVILRISDTGIGMDSELQKKVFDTFFSAKAENALGLGLAIAHAAVKSWGGWIGIRSKPGQGAVFRLFLPVANQENAADQKTKGLVTLKGKTALVVESHMDLSAFIGETLKSEGMNILSASNSIEAIDLFAANMDKISLCVVQMVLGVPDNERTVSQIYDLKPEANVIVMSGFSREFARANLPVGAWSFLQKPFEAPALVQLAKDIVTRDAS